MAHQGSPHYYGEQYPNQSARCYPQAMPYNTNISSTPVANSFATHIADPYPRHGYPNMSYSVPLSHAQIQHSKPNSYVPNPSGIPCGVQNRIATPSRPTIEARNGLLTSSKATEAQPQIPAFDDTTLLLGLADEYFKAAYSATSCAGRSANRYDSEEYYRLITTGLGCLETVLAKCTLLPEQEALVRLRYATVLYEETEDVMEAEEALSKGISIADRHKLLDLKYNMQHLMVRVLFERRSHAALTFLEGITKDAEVYQHIAWVYAFRFLNVSLNLELGSDSRKSLKAALSMLKTIISTAEKYGDVAVLAVASIYKAWVCLKASNSLESFEEAQTSLATARSLQTHPLMSKLHQLNILAAFVDLCCYLQHFDPTQAVEKTQLVQNSVTLVAECQYWFANGSFHIPLRKERMPSCQRKDGMVTLADDGSLLLLFNWMPKDDIYTVAYLLSGIAFAHKNGTDGQKAENMLQDGIKREQVNQEQCDKQPRSLVAVARLQLWRQQLSTYMRLHLAFVLCARSSWQPAEQQISYLNDMLDQWNFRPAVLDHLFQLLLSTYYQGVGRLENAHDYLQKLILSNPEANSKISHVLADISRISILNSLLLLRDPTHNNIPRSEALLAQLSSDCPQHSNRQIQSAYHLLHAILPATTTMIGSKQSLHLALNTAKACSNYPLLTKILALMFERFFKGQVSEQAGKSARASHSMAKKVGDNLWICVGAGLVWSNLEAAGSVEEAHLMWREAWEAARLLPSATNASLGLDCLGDQNDVEMREAG